MAFQRLRCTVQSANSGVYCRRGHLCGLWDVLCEGYATAANTHMPQFLPNRCRSVNHQLLTVPFALCIPSPMEVGSTAHVPSDAQHTNDHEQRPPSPQLDFSLLFSTEDSFIHAPCEVFSGHDPRTGEFAVDAFVLCIWTSF